MRRHRISGCTILLSPAAPELPTSVVVSDSGGPTPVTWNVVEGTASRRAIGWIGGFEREVEVRKVPAGLLVALDGLSWQLISCAGRIDRVGPDGELLDAGEAPPPWSDDDRELVLGPGLVLALALQGTWCLHASGALLGGAAVAFLGESGVGKSTLAAHLGACAQNGWHLVADDILPVTAGEDGAWAWPRFPQRKLSPDAQPGPALPEKLPLAAICDLVPAAPDAVPAAERLPEAAAATALLRQTAGARLFDADLLEAHLAFVAELAARVPVYRLAVPRRREALPAVRETIESLL
jgi:hypothetical protein